MANSWNLLGYRQKVRLARKVAQRRRTELLKLPNVKSAGWGRRVRGGQLTDEICVRVRVAKKWVTQAGRPGKIPEELVTFAEVRGQRRRICVPCDVEAIEKGEPHAPAGASRCKARGPSGTEVAGLGTCRVHRKGKPQQGFLLGCDHVLALSLKQRLPSPSEIPDISIRLGSLYIGQLVELGRRADAAIGEAAVSELVDSTLRVGASVEKFSGFLADVDYLPFEYRIPVRTEAGHYTVVEARWVDTLPGYSFGGYFGNGESRTIPLAIESETEIPLWGGTSGAPLIDDNNRLLGMHFWGAGKRAFAMPIMDVFEAFDPPIRLSL